MLLLSDEEECFFCRDRLRRRHPGQPFATAHRAVHCQCAAHTPRFGYRTYLKCSSSHMHGSLGAGSGASRSLAAVSSARVRAPAASRPQLPSAGSQPPPTHPSVRPASIRSISSVFLRPKLLRSHVRGAACAAPERSSARLPRKRRPPGRAAQVRPCIAALTTDAWRHP